MKSHNSVPALTEASYNFYLSASFYTHSLPLLKHPILRSSEEKRQAIQEWYFLWNIYMCVLEFLRKGFNVFTFTPLSGKQIGVKVTYILGEIVASQRDKTYAQW